MNEIVKNPDLNAAVTKALEGESATGLAPNRPSPMALGPMAFEGTTAMPAPSAAAVEPPLGKLGTGPEQAKRAEGPAATPSAQTTVKIVRSVEELPQLKDGYVRVVHITQPHHAEEIARTGLNYSKYGMLSSTALSWTWYNILDIKYHSTDRRFSYPGAKAVVMDLPVEEHKIHEGRSRA